MRFFFAKNLASADVYQQYYQNFSKYDFVNQLAEHDRLRVDAVITLCKDLVGKNAVIVDIGCGSGALLARLAEAGYQQLFGVDPSVHAPQKAAEFYGLTTVYQSSMHDAAQYVPLAQADLVCIMAVVEHLWDVKSDLQKIVSQLKPGCRVLVEAPPLEFFDGQRGEPYGELSLEHIQFFSAQAVDNLMATVAAKRVAHRYIELPSINAYSLMAMYEVCEEANALPLQPCEQDKRLMMQYLQHSEDKFSRAIDNVTAEKVIVYGAGSHTARLLPRLTTTEVVAVVDRNPNLLTKSIGHYPIQPLEALRGYPQDMPVLISSYRSQQQMAQTVRERFANPVICLY